MIKQHTLTTYWINIYCGLKVGYGPKAIEHDYPTVRRFLEKWMDEHKLCVTLTETKFIYVDGWESGVIVGLINYPRFPKPESEIMKQAIELATAMKTTFEQQRVSIVMPTETIMLGEM